MFIVYDQTWERNLWYGRNAGPVALWDAGFGPVSVFRTKKSAQAAIEVARAYVCEDGEIPEWANNSYIILPLKLERKK